MMGKAATTILVVAGLLALAGVAYWLSVQPAPARRARARRPSAKARKPARKRRARPTLKLAARAGSPA